MRAMIIGCGYIGLQLARELHRQGHEVFGVRRSAEAAPLLEREGIRPVIADITRSEELARLPAEADWVVFCASSSKGGPEDYRAVYLRGLQNTLAWCENGRVRKLVYTGSTGVYGQTDGSAVKESSPAQPLTETGQILVEAEQLLLRAVTARNLPAVILRVAGIYGPGRGHLFQQYLRNEARVTGRGDQIMNMIHRDDVVGAILAALKNGRPGEIYNAVDDEPVAQIHFLRWLSETLGKWMPPAVSGDATAERKRGLTHKKVQNRKLKMELGCAFQYPTFRQGYTAEIKRLEQTGELNLDPEPR